GRQSQDRHAVHAARLARAELRATRAAHDGAYEVGVGLAELLRRVPADGAAYRQGWFHRVLGRAVSRARVRPELRFDPAGGVVPADAGVWGEVLPAGRPLSAGGPVAEIRDPVYRTCVPGVLRGRDGFAQAAACRPVRAGRGGTGIVLPSAPIVLRAYRLCTGLPDRCNSNGGPDLALRGQCARRQGAGGGAGCHPRGALCLALRDPERGGFRAAHRLVPAVRRACGHDVRDPWSRLVWRPAR